MWRIQAALAIFSGKGDGEPSRADTGDWRGGGRVSRWGGGHWGAGEAPPWKVSVLNFGIGTLWQTNITYGEITIFNG